MHNNAGIGHGGDLEQTTFEDWQRVMPLYLPHRLSPRLAQPLARIMTKIVSRG